MKIKIIVIAMVFSLALCACVSDEPKYSCDKNVDSWVKENIQEIRKMTRSEWLDSDARLSVPMYRAFTQEQRIAFWREKFIEVRTLQWSKEELEHIQRVEEFIDSNLELLGMEELSDDRLDEVDMFFYKWAVEAKEKLQWTDQIIYSLVMTGNKVLDTKGSFDSMENNVAGAVLNTSSEKKECTCNRGSMFTCSSVDGDDCEADDCDGSSLGCGFLMFHKCDGRCTIDKILN